MHWRCQFHEALGSDAQVHFHTFQSPVTYEPMIITTEPNMDLTTYITTNCSSYHTACMCGMRILKFLVSRLWFKICMHNSMYLGSAVHSFHIRTVYHTVNRPFTSGQQSLIGPPTDLRSVFKQKLKILHKWKWKSKFWVTKNLLSYKKIPNTYRRLESASATPTKIRNPATDRWDLVGGSVV